MSKTAQPRIIRIPYQASRAIVLRSGPSGQPASLDPERRTVEMIGATEVPALVMDWERFDLVREVLAMSGCQIPPIGQVPLLDSHSRESVFKILGSYRECRVETGATGPELVGRAWFSGTKEGQEAFCLVREGHLTDVSVGYEVKEHIWIEPGQTCVFEGKTYEGPLRIATRWQVGELSLCPIGADAQAKVRAAGASRTSVNTNPTPARAVGPKIKEHAMAEIRKSGGKESATHLRKFVEGLRGLLGLKRQEEEEKPEAEREQGADENLTAEIVLEDEAGNPVAPEELNVEQLEDVIDQLEDEITAIEDEQTKAEEEEPAAGERKGLVKARLSGGARLSPSQICRIERGRIAAIRNLAQAHNLSPELENEFVRSGVSLASAKAKVLDMLSSRPPRGAFQVSMGQTGQEKFRASVQDSLLLRCDIRLDKPAPGADNLLGYSLREICREMLDRAGLSPHGHPLQMIGRALSTTDLPALLVETQRRVLMEAFEKAEETWPRLFSTGTATDFKKSRAVGLEGDVKLLEIPEYGEYTEGRLAEVAEEWFIRSFGRKMVLSRQAIINDDLNALSEIPRLYGEETAALVGDVAYAALLSTPNTMGDGKPLFSTAHNNLFSGLGGAPTVANLGKIVTAMKTQKDSFGKPVSINPRFFLAPVALEVASEQFFNTQLAGTPILGVQAQPLVHNPYGGAFFERVYERRLDSVSSSDYYLLASRGTVTVYFLGGVQSPYIEERVNFDTDGVESKVRMDVGAKALRWLTMAKATA